jgi:hypothetical protein
MPKRKEPELTPEEQFKRFVKTAREHGVDPSGEDLERAFREVTKHTTDKTKNSKSSQSDNRSKP